MKFSIIIVTWNTADLTVKCVKSVFKYLNQTDFEIIIVDNASTDSTVKQLENLPFKFKIIKNSSNLGFAKANNQALKQAVGDYIFLLNPDTELIDNSFYQMLDFLKTHPEIGAVGPKLLNHDLSLQPSCRKLPTFWDQFFIQLKLHNFLISKIPAISNYYMFDFDHNQTRPVEQIMGAAMLIKKSIFDQVGIFDEKFTRIFEEVDLCQRIQQVGFNIYFFSSCQIIHAKGESFKQVANLTKQKNFNHCLYRYFYKHRPKYQLFFLWLLQPFNLFLTWLDMKFKIKNFVGKNKNL